MEHILNIQMTSPSSRQVSPACAPLAAEEPVAQDARQRRQTLLHLKDILLVHGGAKRWANLPIPQGRLMRLAPALAFASPCGSAAELCAAEGDPALP